MKNKFRRSMTSVLLAASLLFSSQSVIAFADYGSKSDTSDLSPVQESVENATEEQQEDPSLSVEPVIGESTEAPVATPMMARANAPVAYSAPEVSGYEEYLYYDYSDENPHPDTIAVYTTAGTKDKGNIDSYAFMNDFSRFTSGSSWQSYTVGIDSFKENGWIFKDWGFKFTKGDDSTDLGNQTDFGAGKRYTFSDGSESWGNEYNGGNRISVNALLRADTAVFHYSIFANFNPLVTVTTDGNGTVTPTPDVLEDEVLIPHGENKFEATYDKNATFTITPKDGFKVKTVTANDTSITANPDGTYTLESVTEPTTLYVEFEKAEDVITADDIDGEVIINVLCPNGHSHPFNMSEGTAGQQGDYYIMSSNPLKANVSIISKAWVKKFNELTGMVQHELTGDGYITFKLTRDDPDEKWKLPKNAKQHDVTIKVKCSNVQENVVVYACYDGVMDEQPIFQGKASHGNKLIDYLKEQELKIKEGYTIEEGWYKKDSFPNEYLFNESDTVSGWTNVYVKCFKNPDENIINNLLDVTLNCENPDHPEEYAKSKTYSDLLPNSYTIGEVKNNDGTYTCDITVYPETYLTDYSQNVTKTNHVLVTTPENPTGIVNVTLKYENETWKPAESPVTFTVTCKESIPLTPSKPSDDVVKAIMDKISVTVDCTNTTGHDPMNHTLTGAEFTVGDIYSVAPFAGKDPVILCPVTINNYVSLQNGFITQYNAATNEPHTLSSGFIPASIVLTYNKDAQDGKGAWENHDLENITLSLTCNPTTPGGGGEGTNPGGNGGDNDDDDDRYTGGNTVTRTINDDDVPLNDRPNNTTTIDDEDVPLADLPDDTVTIDDGEVPLKANPSTGDSLPFAAMAAAALSLGGVIVLNRKKK